MKKKMLWIVLVSLVGVLIAGQLSGNQPRRDSVASASKQLGIDLESRMVALGDVTLHVVFAGPADGEPVILLHGYPEFWYAWRGPMKVLADKGYRVIVPDQRGYNNSDKPAKVSAYRLDVLAGDVVGLADALGYDKINLAGHDFGGAVAWWTAILYPERIRKLAIINKEHPFAAKNYTAQEEEIDWYNTFLKIPKLPGYVGRLGNWGLLVSNLRATSLADTFPDADMDQFRSAWDNSGAINAMGKWYRANGRFDIAGEDGRIALPTLVVLAPDDAFTPSDLTQRSALFLDNGKVINLEAGTHWVIQEKPQQIGEILDVFFKDVVLKEAQTEP